MWAWLRRLTGRAPASAPAPVAAAAAKPAAAAQAAIAKAAASTGDHAQAAAPAAPSFGLRRALVGSKGQVAGFELLLPTSIEQRLAQRADAAAAQARAAHHALLLAAAAPLCKGGHLVLMTVGATALGHHTVAQQAVSGSLLCVPDLASLPVETAAALRARGVRLGVPDGPPAQAPPADFVLMPVQSGGLDTLLMSAQRWREQRAPLPLLATGLQHLEDVERVLRSGFTLVGGALDRSQGPVASRPLSAAALRICELLNHLALDSPTQVVAEAVRADVALSYRLLRYANSPALGLRDRLQSVDAAVMLLGRQELQRWLNVMLLSVAESRQASRAVQEVALARGRLLEGLARRRGEPAPQTLFTMGLMSFLEVLLQTPLEAALKPLHLSAAITQALLQRQGPLAQYLLLAEALDRSEGTGLSAAGVGMPSDATRLEQLAVAFGGLDVVQEEAGLAWAWAASVTASSQTERRSPALAG